MPRRIALLTFALSAVLPAAALAAPAAEAATSFNDRVIDHGPISKATARAAQADATTSTRVPLTEGGSVKVSFTPKVGLQETLAQQYVAFLETLPHGTELPKLQLLVAKPSEVNKQCGGTGSKNGRVLGCYGDDQMLVPSTGLDAKTVAGNYDVRYVLTHEYGHHIAEHRSNRLGSGLTALDWGPKFWSSYEMVCDQAGQRKLFPGDEAAQYKSNPGEAWAETYARLVYPDQPWTWTPRLRPDQGALDAALKDVTQPWTKNQTVLFTMDAGRDRQAFDLPLTLDGALKTTVRGPSGSEVNVQVNSGSQDVGHSERTGAYDTWALSVGCREKPTETLTFTVTRAGGDPGPVTLRVSYAG